MATPNIEDNLFYSAIKIMPASFLMQQKDLTAKYTAMINEKLIPQYKKWLHFLKQSICLLRELTAE
jgi:uncharacterized protein (DUF885 family)